MKGLIFTYLMTYGGAVAAIFNPYIGLLIFFSFGILKPEILWHWSVPAGNYSMTIGAAALFGWALHGFGDWRIGKAWPIALSLLAFLGWTMLSATTAPYEPDAWKYVTNAFKIIFPVMMGISMLTSVERIRQTAWVFVASYGYLAFEFNLNYYNGVYVGSEVNHGMDNNSVCIGLVTCIGLSIFLLLGSNRLWQRLIIFFFMGCMVHTILFSNSRGGMISLIFTAVVAFIIVPKQPKYFFWMIIGVALAIRLAGPGVQQRFMTSFAKDEERDESASNRLVLWSAMFQAMQDNPVTGLGPDHWVLLAHRYGCRVGQEGHSLWLQTGSELGIPGLFFFVSYFGLCIFYLLILNYRYARMIDPWLMQMGRGVIASLCGFMIAAQFVSLEGLELPYYVAMMGIGVIRVANQQIQAATYQSYRQLHYQVPQPRNAHAYA